MTASRVVALLVGVSLFIAAFGGPVGAAKGAPHQWDERIQPLVDFVEDERGLEFDHPVKVRFRAEKDFVAEATDFSDVTERDRKEAAEWVGFLRAIAMVDRDFDAFAAREADVDDNVAGYYDPDRKEIVVRGKALDDVDVRVTLAHELVHALQDQHFDLERLHRQSRRSHAGLTQELLTEGDATAVGWAYLRSLSDAEQNQYYEPAADRGPQSSGDEIPPVLSAIWGLPYVVGPSYVELLRTVDDGLVDATLRDLPDTEEVIVDPVAAARRETARRVAPPALEAGEEKHGERDALGAVGLYMMLATRLDEAIALRAATGYGGDGYVPFLSDGRVCIRDRMVGDSARETDEIADALTRWAATLPVGMASATRADDGSVVLVSCATPGVVGPTASQLEHALFVTLDTRVWLTADLMRSDGLGVRDARCVADEVILDPQASASLQDAAEGQFDAADRRVFDRALRSAIEECGAKPSR